MMSLISLYNTANLAVEPIAVPDGRVTLYVCGVTPYDTTHAGHAFTYVQFDALVRVLKDAGLDVTYTQNVTDIDDDILRKAAELGVEYDELGRRETQQYLEDMAALNVATPNNFVRATDVIPDIVRSVEDLVRVGRAYQSGANVYFDNRSFPDYGALCHCTRQRMLELAAENGGFPDDPAKRDPLDFLLWQGHQAGEPSWPSPFGPGRPGWHIECSTIAVMTLGVPVTIHGGGRDLIFPHHASEAAQAESIHADVPFVQHWMHTGMVRYQGEKMSKSLGNLVLVRDLVQRYSGESVRLYLLSHHYREEFEFDEAGVRWAEGLTQRMRAALSDLPEDGQPGGPIFDELRGYLRADLDTPAAIRRMESLLVDVEAGIASPNTVASLKWLMRVLGIAVGAGAVIGASCSA
jgi:L-cysteine:1D-myo-inositol 2-amino-2-deoxy-alpha-D-glucopyranoside ligase